MKKAKKISIILIFAMLLSLLFASNAFAGVYTQDYVSIPLGESVTIAISSGDCAGTYDVNSYSGSVSAYNSGDGWLEPGEDGYVTITGNSLGSGTVVVGYYVSDLSYVDHEGELYINVDVVENVIEGEAKPVEDTKFDVTIGEKQYTIVADLSNVKLPEGFTKAEGTYGTEKVNVAKYISSDKEEIILYALVQKGGSDVTFMTFNSSKAEFKEAKTIVQGSNTYFLLNLPKSVNLPDGYVTKEVTIGSFNVNAITQKDSKNNDFIYLYALANGKEGYYSYDTKEETIQRCPDIEKKLSPQVEVKNTKNSVNKTMVIILCVAIVAVLAMAVVLIIFITKKKKEDRLDDY